MRKIVILVTAAMVLSATVALAQDASPIVLTAPESTTRSIGDLLSTLLLGIGTLLTAVIAPLLIKIVSKVAAGVGLSLTDQMKSQLQVLVVNGINWAEPKIADSLKGRWSVDLKNQLVARVYDYVIQHGGELLTKMGVDPTSQAFRDALEARVLRALNDPTVPTPASVTPPLAVAVAKP